MSVEQQLQHLIERARSGDYEPFEELLEALREQNKTDDDSLRELASSHEPVLRRAALSLLQGDLDEDLMALLTALVHDSDTSVRLALANALESRSWWPCENALSTLLCDSDSDVRLSAARAARQRPALEARLIERLCVDDYWRVRQELARTLAHFTPRLVSPILLKVLAEDGDSDVQAECAAALEQHFQSMGGFPNDLPRPSFSQMKEAHARVGRLRAGLCPQVANWLLQRVECDVDVEELKKFGSVLTLEAQSGQLPHAYEADAAIDDIWRVLNGKAPRAVVVTGETGVGKTAIINELTHRLAAQDWCVLRVSPADFLVGTVYLGEWETKLRNLVLAVKYPRRVLLYIPNLEELASIGVTSKSDSNVATALAPHIERGDVTIIGESSAESFRKGLGAIRSLRRLFHAVTVQPTENDETRDILRAVAEDAHVEVPDSVLERLMELADFYASGTVQPGRSVGLLRRILGTAGKEKVPFTDRQILSTISASTGIPVDFLDDSMPLDRLKTRDHFDKRVMGQPEAVEAVLDLVTLVKAGLTDPQKPFGVMLFVGPTGVGKTELARALAELLFGDPGRMIRLDMSEYATYEAYERLIGQGANPGLLTATVRERPFSVLLLDEIEKAHLNVFDLCLQIFDAGRLTDAQGRTADFRRTIIILTSNVGSRIATEAPVGFGRTTPSAPDNAVTMRELARSFRPEFLNRIDRIVQFRPLSAETAEKIARREVTRVLERGGIARRKLVIDVEPSVFPLLLREGYSPAYGARPLKRTVERLILLPVAQSIASGEATPGTLLRLVARGQRVEVEVAPPESHEPTPVEERTPSAHAASVHDLAKQMRQHLTVLREKAAPLSSRKSVLLEMLAAPGAWDDRPTAEARSDEVYRIDGLLALLGRLDQDLRKIEDKLSRKLTDRELGRLEEQMEALAGRARHVGVLVTSRDPRELGDALVVVSRVGPKRAGADGVLKLGHMYLKLAQRMGMEVKVIDDHLTDDPPEDMISLQATGAGAFALLAREQGLHYLIQGRNESAESKKASQREVVRVEVHALSGLSLPTSREEVRVEVKALTDAEGRLMERPRFEIHLSHQPTMTTLRAWTDLSRTEAVEHLRPLLLARVAASHGQEGPSGKVIRRYTLSPAPLVRDTQSKKTTGRLAEVLEGYLDQFFTEREEGMME